MSFFVQFHFDGELSVSSIPKRDLFVTGAERVCFLAYTSFDTFQKLLSSIWIIENGKK